MAATLNQAARLASRQLARHSDSAGLDAELLLAHVIGKDRVWLFTHPERILAPLQERNFAALIARRLRGEPLAYLTGEREFYRHRFRVNRHTLIPRPETELIVERVLTLTEPEQPFQLLDLGTGSGVIGLSIAKARPNAVVVATDVSADALEVAKANAHRLKAGNIEFRLGSWFSTVPGQRFDIVVSNPPYVATSSPYLADPALTFEPNEALEAGIDGLDALQAITAGAPDALYPGGRLLLEHGHDQAYAVSVLARAHGMTVVRCYTDLSGLDRFTEITVENSES
ncbi:MAG: peptide chain release factor N(5)-glutamine methyltransferase [Pseudomonadota bacterium]